MSLDRSLKSRNTLQRHRNVLRRSERITILQESGRWQDGNSPLGLPKVAHRKVNVGKKDKVEKKDDAAATATPAAAPTPDAAKSEKEKKK